QVSIREPLYLQAWRGTWLTNPPPAMGGLLVALGLQFLERRGSLNKSNWAQEIPRALRHISGLRNRGLDHAIHEPDIARKMLSTHLDLPHAPVEHEPDNRHGSTTHISIIDAEGTSVAITTSNGEGSGIVVPGTGMHLNNMLGEEDINPGGFHRLPAGMELPSMMAPTMFLRHGMPSLILGSGGSNRLRSAILQAALRHVVLGDPIEKAVCFPRMHNEGNELDVEPGILSEPAKHALEQQGWHIRTWRETSVYFGGVHAIAIDHRGGVDAAGDPRRGGVAWVQ
ncbi:MAG: gamma-glutamyltranspeptidase, partial [Zetaproteobacteria bacterium]